MPISSTMSVHYFYHKKGKKLKAQCLHRKWTWNTYAKMLSSSPLADEISDASSFSIPF